MYSTYRDNVNCINYTDIPNDYHCWLKGTIKAFDRLFVV